MRYRWVDSQPHHLDMIQDPLIPLHKLDMMRLKSAVKMSTSQTLLLNNEVIAIGALVEINSWCYELCFYGSKQLKSISGRKAVLRWLKHCFKYEIPSIVNTNYVRIQGVVDASHNDRIRFAEHLGLVFEARLEDYYGPQQPAFVYRAPFELFN